MGIADLWPILSSACDERIPFPVFLDRFIAKHARPPRLAIDAYMFMFWSQLPEGDENPASHRHIIRNFMAKLWYLVRCNVLFVVVFDGKYKPGKLRHGHIPHVSGAVSYDEAIRYFRTVSPSTYGEGLTLVEQIKQILARNCIDYVQAPAEAEAECAWLQRLRVVDYVVSDDSDTLVFGATQMLRLFNRVRYFDAENKPVLSSTDYYVTPVYMDHVAEHTGLSKERLVLVAVLRGGDYSSGIESIGITRAKEIALCGTTLLQDSPRKQTQDFGALPDFSRMLNHALVLPERGQTLPDPYYALKPELDRAEALAAFNTYLDTFLRTQAKAVFGRMATMKGKVHIDDYYALLYFFPLINHKIFKFTPYSVSFGELKSVEADLAVTIDSQVKRFNLVCSPSTIGTLVVSKGIQSFAGTGRAQQMQRDSYALPKERKYSLKAFVIKLLAEKKYRLCVEFARTKLLDETVIAVLKFHRQKLNEAVYFKLGRPPQDALNGDKDFDRIRQKKVEESEDVEDISKDLQSDSDEEKQLQIEVPLSAVRLVAPDYVLEFESQKSPRKSPRKKCPPQKTTLDLIWPSMLPLKTRESSPTKVAWPPPPKPIFTRTISPTGTALTKHSNTTELSPSESPQKPPSKPNSNQSPTKKLGTRLSPRKSEKSGSFPTRSDTSPTKSRRKSNVLLPGQSKLTSFFLPRGLSNPFQDSLFVVSDDEVETVNYAENYMSMRNTLSSGPILQQQKEQEKMLIYSRLSSPELSPSKRTRKTALSPETSPIKPKTEPTDQFPPLG